MTGRLYDERAYRRKVAEVRAVGDLVCLLCGYPGADTVDHLVPVSKGGSNADANLRPAHRVCNSRRGNNVAPPVYGVNRDRRTSRRW